MPVKSSLANSRTAASQASRPAARQAPKGADRVTAAREQRERRMVMALVGVFAVGAVALMSMNVAAGARVTHAKEALGETFTRLYSRQSEYRAIYGRFASWPELQTRGVALGPRQTLVDSNADASHWFMSIRDRDTGVVCDRTGELMDESADERLPVCRERKAD